MGIAMVIDFTLSRVRRTLKLSFRLGTTTSLSDSQITTITESLNAYTGWFARKNRDQVAAQWSALSYQIKLGEEARGSFVKHLGVAQKT